MAKMLRIEQKIHLKSLQTLTMGSTSGFRSLEFNEVAAMLCLDRLRITVVFVRFFLRFVTRSITNA